MDQVKAKRYFLSMSGRACRYAYFNVHPDVVVLSNSCGTGKDEHGDRLLDFRVGLLSVHIVSFKDRDFFREFSKDVLNNQTAPLFLDIAKTLACYENIEKPIVQHGSQLFIGEMCVGGVIDDVHLLIELKKHISDSKSIETSLAKAIIFDVPRNPKLSGRAFLISLDFKHHLCSDGSFLIDPEKKFPYFQLVCFDGLTVANIKGFVNKPLKKTDDPPRHQIKLWSQGEVLQYATIFEDDVVKNIIFRPHNLFYPLDLGYVDMDQDMHLELA